MDQSNNTKEFLEVTSDKYDESFFSNVEENLGRQLDETGILVLSDFVSAEALSELQKEAAALKGQSYRSKSVYNLYVMPEDKNFGPNAPRNRKFETTKSCVADDKVPPDSVLRKIYNAELFRQFICKLQKLDAIYPYADNLSSININYYDSGDNLEWHFDNADFAITLMVKSSERGGIYEYAPNVRYDERGKENYVVLEQILDGKIEPKRATMEAGDLMIFRGNRSLHRVSKIEQGERILVTLNYNVKPGIPLSEKSRMTFFGRTK